MPVQEDAPIQEDAALNYQNLMDSFVSGQSSEPADSSTVYPDYYGGSYIDESGTLVVWIKEDGELSSSISANISQILGTQDFIVREARYSYNELNAVLDTINDFMREQPKDRLIPKINVVYLNEKENNVVVGLDKMNEQQISLFKKHVTSSPIVTFEEAARVVLD